MVWVGATRVNLVTSQIITIHGHTTRFYPRDNISLVGFQNFQLKPLFFRPDGVLKQFDPSCIPVEGQKKLAWCYKTRIQPLKSMRFVGQETPTVSGRAERKPNNDETGLCIEGKQHWLPWSPIPVFFCAWKKHLLQKNSKKLRENPLLNNIFKLSCCFWL